MPKERPDYYAVLGVPARADHEQLKSAYRELAIELHPDRCPGDETAQVRFQALVQAWEVLGDPERRRLYDAGQVLPGVPTQQGSSVGDAFGRIVDKVFGIKAKRPQPGRDVSYALRLGFAEIALGTSRTLALPSERDCPACQARGFAAGTVPDLCLRCQGCGDVQVRRALRTRIEDCPDCGGRGYIVTTPCPACDGSGREEVQREVEIDVPAGVKDGERLLIREAGRPGRHGGPAGDCLVNLSVAPDPHLRLHDGNHIEMTRPIRVFDAMLGARLKVPTVDGPRVITIPPGTAPGTVLRMSGFGAVDRQTGARGDQLVTVEVELPAALPSGVARELRSLAARVEPGSYTETEAFERALKRASADES